MGGGREGVWGGLGRGGLQGDVQFLALCCRLHVENKKVFKA